MYAARDKCNMTNPESEPFEAWGVQEKPQVVSKVVSIQME